MELKQSFIQIATKSYFEPNLAIAYLCRVRSQRGKASKMRHYIICARNDPSAFWSEYERVRHLPEWTTREIATKHGAMVDAPEALAVLLAGIDNG